MLLMTAVLRVWVLTSTIALRGRLPRPGNALAGALVCGQRRNPGGPARDPHGRERGDHGQMVAA